MEKILLCPGERSTVGFLAQALPLVAVPILGENLITYWLESLAALGVKQARILATDRPDLVRAVVGDGSRWGLRVEVQSQLREVTAEQAARSFASAAGVKPAAMAENVITVDHLPGKPQSFLFRSYRDWFAAVIDWMPYPAISNRIGLRQLQPEVWCGRRALIARSARLHAPCWLGDHVRVGPDAEVGPNAVLESGVVVDRAAAIRSSLVGSETYVGALTKIEDSIAWGNLLIDWRSGSCTQVPDPFLLCALGQKYLPHPDPASAGWSRKRLWHLLSRPWSAARAMIRAACGNNGSGR